MRLLLLFALFAPRTDAIQAVGRIEASQDFIAPATPVVDDLPWYIENINWGVIGVQPAALYRAINPEVYKDGYNLSKGSVGKSNVGLAAHFSRQLAEGRCLGQLTHDFYREIPNPRDKGEPRLSEQSDEPGWLWRRALKHARGNANLASFLIGVCGHDNISQSGEQHGYRVNVVNERNLKLKEKTLGEDQDRLTRELERAMQERRKKLSTDKGYVELEKRIERMREELRRVKTALADPGRGKLEPLGCPDKSSPFYMAGALGTDIDPALKKRVADAQAKGDASKLPSKTYHVYGANYLSCLLRMEGTEKDRVPLVQDALATAYRSRRFCERINELTDALGPAWEEYRSWNQLFENGGSLVGSSIQLPDHPSRHVDLGVHIRNFLAKGDFQKLEKKFGGRDQLAREYQAALVYRYGTIGPRRGASDLKSLSGLECLNLTLSADLDGPRTCPQFRISDGDCQGVMGIVNSWKVDMEWTRAQHRAGAEFAAKNCQPSGKSMDAQACEAMGATSATPPASSTTNH